MTAVSNAWCLEVTVNQTIASIRRYYQQSLTLLSGVHWYYLHNFLLKKEAVYMRNIRKIGSGLVLSMLLTVVVACGNETPDRAPEAKDDAASAATSAPAVAQTATTTTGVGVVLSTNLGDIELLLDDEKAPLSVANFLAYADSGHYEGTIFHRVISGFMVQGGGFDQSMQQKATQDPIENEAANGLKNVKYSIAMARTGVVNSATSQFFINVVDNGFLDHRDTSAAGFGYAVFGQVVAGHDVVDKMAAAQTGSAGRFPKDVPVETIVIQGVSRK